MIDRRRLIAALPGVIRRAIGFILAANARTFVCGCKTGWRIVYLCEAHDIVIDNWTDGREVRINWLRS